MSSRPIKVADLNLDEDDNQKKGGKTGAIIVVAAIAITATLLGFFIVRSFNSSNVTDSGNDPQKTSQTTDAEPGGYDECILPDSAERYYERTELESLDLYELYIARNEVFARHGRGFKTPELQSYFDSRTWYTKEYEPEEFDAMASPLNDFERKNVALMLEVEKARNSPYI